MAVKSVDRAVQTDGPHRQRNCLWVDRLYIVQVRLEFRAEDVVRRRRRPQLGNAAAVRHTCWPLLCCSANRNSKDQVDVGCYWNGRVPAEGLSR